MNGITLQHRPSRELDLPALVRALGVDDVRTVDPMDMKETRRALKEAVASDCLKRHRVPVSVRASDQRSRCGV
ncbi:MAG: hypothetical protein ACLT98_08505 [Eggerthellaceae bacterium]